MQVRLLGLHRRADIAFPVRSQRVKAHKRIRSMFSGTALVAVLLVVNVSHEEALAADPNGYELLNFGELPYAMTPDGGVLVGTFYPSGVGRAFYRASGAMTDLGLLPGGTYSNATGVSADGSVIVGSASIDGAGTPHAFRWTAGGMVDLGSLGNGYSIARDVSADGSVIVGVSLSIDGYGRAFRWTSGGMVDIGTLGGDNSEARGVNGDGLVVVGYSDIMGNSEQHAFRWEAGTMADLGTLGGGQSRAFAISADGSVVVGDSLLSGGERHAFRWVTGTMSDLGTVQGYSSSIASGTNADGSVVVGSSSTGGDSRAFRWTEAGGMVSVEDWLRSHGVAVASDFTAAAYAVSADGSIVVGQTQAFGGFIARVVAGTGSGIIDMDAYTRTLAANPATSIGLDLAGTTLNGAHGEPMRNLLEAGQQSLSVTADGGYDNDNSFAGGIGIADLSYGIGLENGTTVRLSAGGHYTRQDIDTGGYFSQRGFYVAPEMSAPLTSGLYATVGAYYSPGRLDVERGYLNGGMLDYSRGATDTDTWAAKVRLDWLNAVSVDNWNFTPYGSLTYAHAKMDSYTEQGGSFPSSFDRLSDHATVARMGLDVVGEVSERVRLLGKIEAAYRFERKAAAMSGQIVGLSGFNLAGQDHDQLWVRGGVGAEVDTGVGTASLSVNVTTQGDDPNIWLKSGWRVKF